MKIIRHGFTHGGFFGRNMAQKITMLPLPFDLGEGKPKSARLIRSDRKTIALELDRAGTLTIRAPQRMPAADIQRFLLEKEKWLRSHLDKQEHQAALPSDRLTEEEIDELFRRALEIIPARVAHFAPLVGVSYGRITIRNQRTRWGSCSSEGNLNFNCLLMLAPQEAMDYVVVHELCHRLEMNHSARFWAQVARVCPDYKAQIRWFKENGSTLMARMFG